MQYTLAESPEIVLDVPGRKDTKKARERAMDLLMERMDAGEISVELKDGFGPDQLILVKKLDTEASTSGDDSDPVIEAVQILNDFATLKLKVQESREAALTVRATIDLLFSDESVSEEEMNVLKEGFKVLKNFAQFNSRYQEALPAAKQARAVLDEVLKQAGSSYQGGSHQKETPIPEPQSQTVESPPRR